MLQSSKSSSVTSTKSSVAISTQNQSNRKSEHPRRNSVLLNFVAGGIGGTAGTVITCPLDVVQTRLQSSYIATLKNGILQSGNSSQPAAFTLSNKRFGLNVFFYMKFIAKSEGIGALYKGLVPNLIGIAPSRAIYFSVYTKSKSILSSTSLSNSSKTHMLSALTASWSTSTITNPIWFLKTRLQLDTTASGRKKHLYEVIQDVFRNEGVSGFYRGLSASYFGAVETMIYFVLYEKLKMRIEHMKPINETNKLYLTDYVVAAFLAKSLATVSVYPHEVVRTRVRQEASVAYEKRLYRGFYQTLMAVYKTESFAGLYGGMGAHLMRQVPNTVIMFLTYETIVNWFSKD